MSPNADKTHRDGIIAAGNHEHFYQKHHTAIMPSLLALFTLCDKAQIRLFLFVSRHQMQIRQVGMAKSQHEINSVFGKTFMISYCEYAILTSFIHIR
jgi:hypothetical protein